MSYYSRIQVQQRVKEYDEVLRNNDMALNVEKVEIMIGWKYPR